MNRALSASNKAIFMGKKVSIKTTDQLGQRQIPDRAAPRMPNRAGQLAILPWVGVAISTLLLPTSAQANAVCDLNLGAAGKFAVFGHSLMQGGSTFSLTNPKSTIYGNVGLGPDGTQNFSDGHITGTLFVDPSANNSHSNNVQIDGGTDTEDLTPVVNDALRVVSAAATLTPTQTVEANITNSTTLTGNGNLNVINLNSIKLTGANQFLTLSGSDDDFFLINVAQSIKLTNSSSGIRVSGVPASHVLFNLTSQSGEGLKVSGNAMLVGTYLSPRASINLHSGRLDGEIISAANIALTSGVWIEQHSFTVPPGCP